MVQDVVHPRVWEHLRGAFASFWQISRKGPRFQGPAQPVAPILGEVEVMVPGEALQDILQS